MDTKDLLVKLGWSKYDGNMWAKGNVHMFFDDALEFELTRLVAFHRSSFVCPDCGYKVMPSEFIEEEFYNVVEELGEVKA
jgi:hypothetical protein